MAYTDIDKPSDYFNTVTWTGNSSTQAITGVGFQPDFIWKKSRSQTYSHRLSDSVRGGSKVLNTDNTNAEATDSNEVISFDSDGFTLGNSYSNFTGHTHVAWNWLAGGTAVSNTQGSITSSVSANTTSGFSIVSYTGTGSAGTIGHGLGVAPSMYIVKKRSAVEDWEIYHKSLGATKDIRFTTGASFTSSLWNNTEPTNNVFNVLTQSSVNASGATYIAYCFAEKKGFSKFGSYVGNGTTDGPFVYTGFKPAFVMHKRTDGATDWFMFDNKRIGYNSENYRLTANSTLTEADPGEYDILSNGFKIRFTSGNVNASGGTYIYMAFAENPFTTSTGIPATAR